MKDMTPGSEWNKSDNKFVDISSEAARTYTFPGGNFVSILEPTHLSVSESGGHRVLDADDISHYIPKGWIELKWRVKDGKPHFVK